MKTILFHVRIFFCPMFQIKRKKMGKYLFTILKYVYLCVKFNSVTQEVTHILHCLLSVFYLFTPSYIAISNVK